MKIGFSRLTVAAYFIASCTALTGCQKPFVVKADPDLAAAADHTGGTTEDGKLLTAASDDGGIQILKNSIPQDENKNGELAASIDSTKVLFLDKTSKPVSAKPDRLKVTVQLRPRGGAPLNLEFDSALTKGRSNTRVFSAAASRQSRSHRLSAVCATPECLKIVMRLVNTNASERAEAGFIYRIRQNVEVRSSGATADVKDTSVLSQIEKTVSSVSKDSRLETQEVAWGNSSFALKMNLGKNASFCLSGRLVETNDLDESLQAMSCDGKSQGLSAMMIGNDNAGSLIVRLQEKSAMLIMLILVKEGLLSDSEGSKPAPTTEAPPAVEEDARLPFNANHVVTQAYESDRTRPEVVAAIGKWTSVNNSPDNVNRMRQFVMRIQPNLRVVYEGFSKYSVPTEFLAITAIESSYFTAPGYPIEVNPESSAAGPWQFVDNTARGQGLKIFSTAKAKKINPCDQRGHLAPATAAAGKYFRSLLNLFPQDPRLALMAYFWGQGNVQCFDKGDLQKCAQQLDPKSKDPIATKVARLQAIRSSNFNFWTVKTFNMGRKDAPQYVIRFLAAQFVAREPHRYGVALPPAAEIASIPPAKDPVCK